MIHRALTLGDRSARSFGNFLGNAHFQTNPFVFPNTNKVIDGVQTERILILGVFFLHLIKLIKCFLAMGGNKYLFVVVRSKAKILSHNFLNEEKCKPLSISSIRMILLVEMAELATMLK